MQLPIGTAKEDIFVLPKLPLGKDIKLVGDDARWRPGSYVSDVTLCTDSAAMPVMRFCTPAGLPLLLSISEFSLVVGNECALEVGEDEMLDTIALKGLLENIAVYTGNYSVKPLYRERDEFVAVTSQACVLPSAGSGPVPFHARIFSYASRRDDPSVLVIVATRRGTSIQVAHGQCDLYFNDHGKSVDFIASHAGPVSSGECDKSRNDGPIRGGAMYIVQVPLKTSSSNINNGVTLEVSGPNSLALSMVYDQSASVPDWIMMERNGSKNVPYPGTRGLALERDENLPISVTIQLYAVSSGDADPSCSTSLLEWISESLVRTHDNDTASRGVRHSGEKEKAEGGVRPKIHRGACTLCHKPLSKGMAFAIKGEPLRYCSRVCAKDASDTKRKGHIIRV